MTNKQKTINKDVHHGMRASDFIVRDNEIFIRMNVAERLQHFLLVVSFTLLVITGLPLLLDPSVWLQRLFFFESSFALRGLVHRSAAVGLMAVSAIHLFYISFTRRGRETFLALLPELKDVTDAFESFNYNLGLTRWLCGRGIFKQFFTAHPYWLFLAPPQYGRYNFIEKFEYLGVWWGNFVMIVTGFFLWKTDLAFRLFPFWMFDLFKIVHSFEALLAFLAIIIWHLYNVHLNPEVFPMSRVWIDGKITGHELRTLHPLEFQEVIQQRLNEGHIDD